MGTAYEVLEERKVLAALFPTYINGQFTLGNGPGASSPYDLVDTFELSSLPSATKTIYLDSNGHHSVNNSWGHDIVFDPFDTDGNPATFSNDELIEIQIQFQNMAEDFLPFNVNVTTKDPGLDAIIRSGTGDDEYGIRVVNTQGTPEFSGFCGIAFLNSFGSDIDNPVFTICKGSRNGALVHSHETGHALGLRHDGLDGAAYHPGAGSGENSWGPIMGAPFDSRITQWSDGNYAGSTNTEDDYEIITTRNGFGFRADDFGSTIASASPLTVESDGSVFDWGIIEQNTDVDVFEFTTATGDVALTVNSFEDAANLDILATIRDENGNVLFTSNPEPGLNAGFDVTLAGGTYYLTVEGTGQTGLYNDYGSVGFYTVEGVVVAGLPVGEVGRIESLTDVWQTVNFLKPYVDPVVVAGPASRVGAAPLNIRIRDVTSTSFQIHIDEWDYLDGRHRNGETVDYLVMEAGEYALEDGTVIMAGNRSTQDHRWSTNSLSDAFKDATAPPVVLTQTVTVNDPTSVTTRTRRVSKTEFQVKLQEEQAQTNSGGHGNETVSWIAFQQNTGTIGTQKFESWQTGAEVDHRNYNLLFQSDFSSAPAFLASMQTYYGGDTATVRYRTLTDNGATIFVEEERSLDQEIRHRTEIVGYLAIELGEIFGSDLQLRGQPGSNYDLLVGNLSDFNGNYPDYSDALKLVQERDANSHQHSLLNDAHKHGEFAHDEAWQFDKSEELAKFVRISDLAPVLIGNEDSDDARFEISIDAQSLAELAGSVIEDLESDEARVDWFSGVKLSASEASEVDSELDS